VKEAGVFGAISISNGKSFLFIPRLDDSYRIWCGEIHPPNRFRESYAVDEVVYAEDLPSWVSNTLGSEGEEAMLHLMAGINSDSGSEAKAAEYPGIKAHRADGRTETGLLYNLLSHCRVTKSEREIEVMRYAAYVASNAHAEMMRHAKACTFEYELEAKFQYEIYRNGGCRKCAYTCIGACGPNAAVLHYGHAAAPNDRELQPTDMVSVGCYGFLDCAVPRFLPVVQRLL
jgi:Xaa-Pro dipeptidase